MKPYYAIGCAVWLFAGSAFAVDLTELDKLPMEQKMEAIKQLSPQELAIYHKAKEAAWKQMTDAEKLMMIEKKRAEKLAYREKQWNAMTDADKIRFVEEKWRRKKAHLEQKNNPTKAGDCPK